MRLIDADALKEKAFFHEIDNVSYVEEEDVDNAPTVDAVQIVRCKDCKYHFVDGENVRFNCCELNHNKVQSDDWFCADGERRESDG